MNKIFKLLTLVLIMTLCIGVIFAFVGCDEDKPIDELKAIDVVIGNGEDILILSVNNANIEAIKEAIKVTASFNDKDIAEIIDEYEIVGFDPNIEGEQIVTIRYMGFETTIKVSVLEAPVGPILTAVKVDKDSVVLSEDELTEEALRSKITVTGVYSDGYERIIPDYTIEGFDPNLGDHFEVKINYCNFAGTIVGTLLNVTIERKPVEPTIDHIKVAPEKLTIEKEKAYIDTIKDKITVTAVYSDQHEEPITDYTIEGFDANANGEQTVSVKYLTFSATIKVTIERPVEPTLESIRVNLEKLTIDKEDASLDAVKQRITVTAVYSDESEKAITDYTIDGSLDLDSSENQTLTISYQGKSTTLVVLITERQVPVEPTKYYVYLNNNATEMVENEETDKTDGRLAEYSAVIALSVNDSIVIKDSLGNTYANYQDCDFDGTAKTDGNYTVYLKLYPQGHAIYVAVPQGGTPEIVKMYINSDTEGRVLEEYPSSDENVTVQYFIKVELEVGDLVIFKAGNVEYDAYEKESSFDGVVSIDGEYEFYVKLYKDDGHSIWVKKPISVDPAPSPDTMTVYFYNYKNWSAVNVYAWNSVGNNTWPGEAMTAVDDHENWYKLEISDDYESLLFNAGDKMPQTLNLTIDKENLYYNGYEWTNGFNVYEGILSRTIYYYNKFNWEKVNAYAWTESGDSKIENANWSGVEMTAVEGHDGWFSIEIGIEYKEVIFNDGTNQTENLVINDEDGLYYYNDGWLKEFGESVDPTPVITENSVVKLVVGETETLLLINENSIGGDLEFMIAKIEFKANTTFKITVDEQEYGKYKDSSLIKGSIVEAGFYCIYVSNNGIYAATYTAPTPTVPTLTENSVVKLYIQKGVETAAHTLTKNDSSLSGAIEYMITNVSLTANDIITIKIDDIEVTNYKNDLVEDGHVSEDGNYSFYVSDEGIHVEKAEIVPVEPTLESIRVNLEKLTIDKEDANLDTIKSKIIVYAVYSDENENAITDYTLEGELDLDSTENQTLTISYQGKTATLVVLINEPAPIIESIKVDNTYISLKYNEATIDAIKERIVVSAVYSDQHEEPIVDYTIEGFDANANGEQTVSVKYLTFSATIKVTIERPVESTLESIRVNLEKLTIDKEDANLDTIKSKIIVYAVYSDENENAITDYTIEGELDSDNYEGQTLTISYQGKTATLVVLINEPAPIIESIKVDNTYISLKYNEATIDAIKERIVVSAVYSDQHEESIADYTIEGFDANANGEQTVSVKYLTFIATIKVTIERPVEPTLESIKINIEKLTIDKEDASLDAVKQRITVTAVYSDESEKAITDYTIDGSLDLDSSENQTLTISYQGKSTTLIVLITERQVPVEPTKYYVYLNNNATEMVENEETNKTDGKIAEYIATVDLGIGDTITIKDSLGTAYESFENFSGTAVWAGNHTIYLKLYSNGNSIWVSTPQVNLTAESIVKLIIDNDIKTLSRNEDNTDSIEYKIENVAITTENVIKVLVNDTETANYKNTLVVNRKVSESGNYNFFVSDEGIYVAKAEIVPVDPEPTVPTLTENSVVKLYIQKGVEIAAHTLTKNDSSLSGAIEYMITNVSLTANDIITIKIDDIEVTNYKNDLVKDGHVSEDGSYNFYVSDEGIHVEKAEIVPVDPEPTVPSLTENSVVKLYIQKGVETAEHTLTKNDSSLSGAIEYMITNVSLTANDIITIKIDDIEVTNYKNDLVKDGHVSEDGSYNFYVSDEGIHVEKAEVVPVDPEPTVPTLTENSVVELVVDETETLLVINENAEDGVIEFMIENIEFEANTAFKITVDGQEYNNYKEESPINGSIVEAGFYCIYVSNNGIYVAVYTAPTPYSVSIIVNNDDPITMTESQCDDANVTAQYTITITLKKDDVVKIIDSTDFVFVNYEPTTSFNGTAEVDGEYTFYVKKYEDGGDSIWVAVPTSVDPDPIAPTPYSVSIIVNNDDPITMTESQCDDANVTAQYTITITLKKDDVVKIIDSTDFVFVNYETTTSFNGTAEVDGEYTFYAKKYEGGGDSIWVAVPTSVDPVPDTPITTETVTVYYYNLKGWDKVNAYAWLNNDKNAFWPGAEMTAVEGHDNWYSIEISASFTTIIFNAGLDKEQTRDITIVANKYYFNGYEWTDGFNIQEKRILYFKNTGDWNTVNAYSWNDINSKNNAGWPGQAMTAVEGHDGWYMIELSADYNMVIFNNGSVQTSNINYYVGCTYYDYSLGKWVESF